MALIQCPECQKEMSSDATACPHCGKPNTQEPMPAATTKKATTPPGKELRQIAIGCGAVVLLFLAFMVVSICSTPKTTSPPANPAQLRTEQIKKLFSPWDGSHRGLTARIKGSMNDPDSYEHVETGYWDKGDHLLVKTTFRGKNAFGGVVKNTVTAKIDLNGKIIQIVP